jgi:pimeloyl-ACP methyl ester carboxylesterase
VNKPIKFTRHGSRNLLEGSEPGDSVDGAPGRHARPQHFRLSGARWLAVGDRVVQQVPVHNRRLQMNERQMVDTRLGTAVRVRGEGPVAVLWHSVFVHDRTWNTVEADLARARRLVIITGPGHRASPDPGRRYDMDECAEAAADVLAALGIDEPVDWLGNAWGGHVGVVFAARWPERCKTLITLGTPVQSYAVSERLRIWALLPVVRLLGPVGFIVTGIQEVLLSPTTRAQDPEAARLVADCLRGMNRAGLVNAVVSISLRRPDLTPRLAQIRCSSPAATTPAGLQSRRRPPAAYSLMVQPRSSRTWHTSSHSKPLIEPSN